MRNLNRFVVLFFTITSLSMFSQTNNGNPLPKVILTFDAIYDDTKVELTWSSNTENNNNFFTIEKSKDAITFEEVTSIKSFGNNSSIISYFDVDFIPYEGISYYRLKQTNTKGNILSSRLVSVNNRNSSTSLSMNSISMEELPSNLLGSENKEVLVVLRNEKGIESYSKIIIDINNVAVSADNDQKLDNGTYTVIASSDNKLYSQKLVVR